MKEMQFIMWEFIDYVNKNTDSGFPAIRPHLLSDLQYSYPAKLNKDVVRVHIDFHGLDVPSYIEVRIDLWEVKKDRMLLPFWKSINQVNCKCFNGVFTVEDEQIIYTRRLFCCENEYDEPEKILKVVDKMYDVCTDSRSLILEGINKSYEEYVAKLKEDGCFGGAYELPYNIYDDERKLERYYGFVEKYRLDKDAMYKDRDYWNFIVSILEKS